MPSKPSSPANPPARKTAGNSASGKIDLKRELKTYYAAAKETVVEVNVPPFRYLMINGEGDPNTSPAYVEAVEALFSVSYTTKFAVKKGSLGVDYAVMPLEGLWWADEMSAFLRRDKSRWKWTMMIHQPDFVPEEVIRAAQAEVTRKKGLPGCARLRLETFAEGRCAQILHVGPFDEEGPTIERMHAFIADRSALAGKHHEIYLSDVRRADPRKWRTILRQPMQ